MEINILFNLLNERTDPNRQRQALVVHLKNQAERIVSTPDDTTTVAYEIAGIMATDYARSLESDDPIQEVLAIAGELEINPSDADELQEELLQSIKNI